MSAYHLAALHRKFMLGLPALLALHAALLVALHLLLL